MPEAYVTRDEAGPSLLEAMALCGRLAVVRAWLRTRVNDLNKSVDERRRIFDELKEQEAEIVALIDQSSARLTPDDAAWMQEQKKQL